MYENRRKAHSIACNYPPLEHPKDDVPVIPRPRGDEFDLLDVIYGRDPRTGLPQGDLCFYLTKDTSPEVRQFIENNLLTENNTRNVLPLDADDIAVELARRPDETSVEYAARISEYYRTSIQSPVAAPSEPASVPLER